MDQMMKIIRALLLLMLLVAIPLGVANATVIIDTGTPPTSTDFDGTPMPLRGVSLHWIQWLAIEFTLDKSYDLMNAKGYAYTRTPGDLTVAIRGDYGGLPGGSPLYSESFYSHATSQAEWQGVSGMNWRLGPGTYWLSLEIPLGPEINANSTFFRGGDVLLRSIHHHPCSLSWNGLP